MKMKYEIKQIEEQAKEIQRIRGELVDSIAEIDKELAKVNELEAIKEEIRTELSVKDNLDNCMVYREMSTREIVTKRDSVDYIIKKLGLEINYNGDKELTKEFLISTAEWYFSGNWIEERENYDDI